MASLTGLLLSTLFVASALCGYPAPGAPDVHVVDRDAGDTTLGRLPLDLDPMHYTVELIHDIYTAGPPFNFNGSVSIRFSCQAATDMIYVNSWLLTMDDASVTVVAAADSPVPAADPSIVKSELDTTLQFYKTFLASELVVGAEYIISMNFAGVVATSVGGGDGVWWDSYVTLQGGITKYIVNTQFQPSNARTSFPSFDEPGFKSTFDMILWRKTPNIALSNMPLASTTDMGNGWVADRFDTSARMSVYLVAFVIGEFEMLESFTARGIPVRCWARPDYVGDLAFANSIAAAFQDYYETWTGVDYPLPKQDHVAIPSKGGAMENYGLIIYAEYYLLYSDERDTLRDQRNVAGVIGHELAHMWFGDYVTCQWWDDTWLNEAFASYYETLPFESVLGWSGDERAFENRVRRILQTDSVATSSSVRVQVDSPWQASSAFGSITYSKGSSIVRMLGQVLGVDTFKRGINRYLNAHAYQSVVTDDLWQALTEQAEIDGVTDTDGSKLFMKEKFDPWVDQRGYPIVVSDRAGSVVSFYQLQFLSPRDQTAAPSPYGYEWYVPLTWTDEQTLDFATVTQQWLNRANASDLTGVVSNEGHWYMENLLNYEFHRVWYDSHTYGQLVNQLQADPTVIPFLSRFQILNDAFEIAKAGYFADVVAMDTTLYLDQEDTFLLWDTFNKVFSYQANMLRRYPVTADDTTTYMRSKLDPAYNRMGWTNQPTETNFQQAARALILSLSCFYGRAECISQSQTLFAQLQATPTDNNIPIDQRTTVYCAVARDAGAATAWDFLFSQYRSYVGSVERTAGDEKSRYLQGMACPSDTTLLNQFISYAFNPSQIDANDANMAMDILANSRDGAFVLWDYITANWQTNPVPAGVDKYDILQEIVRYFGNDDDVTSFNNFVAANPPVDENESSVFDQAAATVNANKLWNDVNNADFESFFKTN